jgi:hypothetical protein
MVMNLLDWPLFTSGWYCSTATWDSSRGSSCGVGGERTQVAVAHVTHYLLIAEVVQPSNGNLQRLKGNMNILQAPLP